MTISDRPSRSDTFRRVAVALSFVGAGVLTFAGFLATPWEGERDNGAYLNALAENPVQGQIAAVLLHFGYLLLVPATLGALPLLRGRGAGWGNAAAVLGTLGAGLSGLLVVDFYDLALAQNLPPAQAVEVYEAAGASFWLAIIGMPSVIGAIGGILAATVGLARAGVIPWWPAAFVGVGWAVPFVAGPVLWAAALGIGLLAIGLAFTGYRILRLRPKTEPAEASGLAVA